MPAGRSLELFFVDGAPEGMLTAEVFNWTGHILKIPRTRIRDGLRRDEAGYTGVYILLGERDGMPCAYIGEIEDVAGRIRDHDSKKEWWTSVTLVTAADNKLNKAHVKYLESRLVEAARAAQVMELENGNTPPRASLSEAATANMESFLENVLMVLPAIGIDLFVNRTRPSERRLSAEHPQSPQFMLRLGKHGVSARTVVEDGEFIVQAGSTARPVWMNRKLEGTGYARLHAELIAKGILAVEGEVARFTQSYGFSSPSAAAAVVSGRPANGLTEWKLALDGRSYKAWEAEQLGMPEVAA
ncbi:MAG: hypothetical protein RLZ26_1476 [Pseudomonadota bacterium]